MAQDNIDKARQLIQRMMDSDAIDFALARLLKTHVEHIIEERNNLWAMFRLINDDNVFVTFEDEMFFYDPNRKMDADVSIGFNYLCSDTFKWACADAERIELSDAPIILKLLSSDEGYDAVDKWIQERRGGEDVSPFIEPVVVQMDKRRKDQKRLEWLLEQAISIYIGNEEYENINNRDDIDRIMNKETAGEDSSTN